MKIVQIVPRLGASADGVADYARCLASALEVDHRVATTFLSGDPNDAQDAGASGRRTIRVPARTATGLAQAVAKCGERDSDDTPPVVVVHYVNYGYAARGCPFWLIRGLARWKRQTPGARLIAIFHELYAFGPPWRSSFWLTAFQRWLAKQVWKQADEGVTSLRQYADKIISWDRNKQAHVYLTPVFSTVGEPMQLLPLAKRLRRLVIFGGAGTRRRLYQQGIQCLERAADMFKISEILDIGPASGIRLPVVSGLKIKEMGRCTTEEISNIMEHSLAGILEYPVHLLGKSTVFAAYCAHGMVPLVTHNSNDETNGLVAGRHYIVLNDKNHSSGILQPQDVANYANKWYRAHSLALQAKNLEDRLLHG